MSKLVAPANILFRPKRQLRMVRRIVILVIILIVLGFPYTMFCFMSFFTGYKQIPFSDCIFIRGCVRSICLDCFISIYRTTQIISEETIKQTKNDMIQWCVTFLLK